MVAFSEGEIAIGGAYGYIHRIDAIGTTIERLDAVDDIGNRMRVNGITFDEDGNMYSVLGDPSNLSDYNPHDIVWIPDNSGYVVLLARLDNTAILRKYDLDGAVLNEYTIETDTGWTTDKYMKVDIACDSTTVYYTDQLYTVFKFDLDTGTQLSPWSTLSPSGNYRYNAFKLLPDDAGLVIDMSDVDGANGPKYSICLDAAGIALWTDETLPADEIYHVFKRSLTDGSDILSVETSLQADGSSAITTALGCYYFFCGNQIQVVTIGFSIVQPKVGAGKLDMHVYITGLGA